MIEKVPEIFSSMVFDDQVMQERLPKETYKKLQKTIRDGLRLDVEVANVVANAMKDWAIEKGVTHYTHWFQPMTGITAEKHDSFISPRGDGKIIMEFSGKELVRGEADGSSFPSGGLRATFEARGYTAWDPTSFAFIKDGVLCIPTAFCSYGGEALDKKTPLLRSMEAIDAQALRVVKLFGNENVTSVKTTVGAEQEYFLVDRAMFEKRKDLIFTGRTLFGSMPPKGQEMDDHYFGSIKPRVQAFMNELNVELWKLGILSKTEHNEAAPAQHELAPIFATTNIATDHNQIIMELMQRLAKRHDMICLLHEKPFQGVNGSGKHNNWSISTNTGVNLFEPGETPYDNAQFLLFLCAVLQAVDEYQDLIRISVATAGNDHRLGGHEAPPAVISVFLGDELSEILNSIETETAYDAKEKVQMKIGVHVLPRFPKDTTDRNRTSPIAFTGNKFEFRSVGASASIADINTVINTAVAEVLKQFADKLEGAEDFNTALHDLIRQTIRDHKRIIFNGNGYDVAWIKEATEQRGLLNLRTTPDALPHMLDEKNVRLFTAHQVFTETEVRSRVEIMMENYCKILNIEVRTMLEMCHRDILPAISKFTRQLTDSLRSMQEFGVNCDYEAATAQLLGELKGKIFEDVKVLREKLSAAMACTDTTARANAFRDQVIPVMESLRKSVNLAETKTASDFWPYPVYEDLLFGVQ